MIRRIDGATSLVVAGLLLGGCDAPTESTSLEVELTASPDPTTAEPSSGVTYTVTNADDTTSTYEYAWKTSFALTIRETGGLAADITAVNVKVQQASGGIVITPTGGEVEHYQFNSSASGNRVPANGTATVGFEVWYSLPNGGKEALITVGLSFRDDDGYTYQDTAEVKGAP
jgi:hypothetical protein